MSEQRISRREALTIAATAAVAGCSNSNNNNNNSGNGDSSNEPSSHIEPATGVDSTQDERSRMNRIFFADNPWPNGHAIKELVWSGSLVPENGLWFDLHLRSADYYAEDKESEHDDEDAESDWKSKIAWNNYHQCILSSTHWGHKGFLAGTRENPLNLAAISGRAFDVDPLPPPEHDDRAFGIYLLGHDGAADHQIRFTRKNGKNYELDWRGKIALEYIGESTFDYTFHARCDALIFSGIRMPKGTKKSQAASLIKPFLVDIGELKPIQLDDFVWLAPANSQNAK